MNGVALGILSLILIAGSGVLWFRGIGRVEIPKNRGGFVAAWIGGVVLALATMMSEPGLLGGIPASLALVGGLFFLMTFVISPQKVSDDAIKVGAMLPVFKALDQHGDVFDSAVLDGQPVLLKFFRGHW